jgi:hypothetical protein
MSLHVVHGVDVARWVVAVGRGFTAGERWVRVYFLVRCTITMADVNSQ